MNEENND